MESMEIEQKAEKERGELLDKVLKAVGLELVELPEHFSNEWHFACQRAGAKGDGWVSFSRDDASWFSFRDVSSTSYYSLYAVPRLFVSRSDVFEKLRKTKCFVWQSLDSMSHLAVEHKMGKEEHQLVWKNPFFGCKSDDELRVKMDLLCLGEVNKEKEAQRKEEERSNEKEQVSRFSAWRD